MELIGPYLIACTLLVVAGVAKAARPGDTSRALTGLVPVSQARMATVVRVGAVLEAALGAVALVAPRPATALAVAVSYGSFAVGIGGARWPAAGASARRTRPPPRCTW